MSVKSRLPDLPDQECSWVGQHYNLQRVRSGVDARALRRLEIKDRRLKIEGGERIVFVPLMAGVLEKCDSLSLLLYLTMHNLFT